LVRWDEEFFVVGGLVAVANDGRIVVIGRGFGLAEAGEPLEPAPKLGRVGRVGYFVDEFLERFFPEKLDIIDNGVALGCEIGVGEKGGQVAVVEGMLEVGLER
jgi:hypothetical protein